ncbi:type II secretion system F family protein [Curtobacterium sp. MCSS17_016]|uniref:type II secretion system F family protein n=1 Tax=Curtobacterium sp. MCSS17_016 TaxID=2175644 RepID=UPI000DA90514|nr:type II secretion system F family protein [Curtobacterium sp. MCSS17_016]WIE80855.1 type II secretion system F family protein [Curtobacterium sp. MCSS17_016]
MTDPNLTPQPPRRPRRQPRRAVRVEQRITRQSERVTVVGEGSAKSWRPSWLQYEKSNKRNEISDAVRSLGEMLETSRGETVPLATLAEQYHGSELGGAFQRIYDLVQSGQKDLAEAFRTEPKIFPKVVGDLLVVGTRAGTSGISLQKAADIIDEGQDLTHKIRSAVMQPAILLGVIILFLYAVILFVLPTFATMFKSFGKPLPPLSQAVMASGGILGWAGGVAVLVIGGWFAYYRWWGSKNDVVRVKVARVQLRVPFIGQVIRAQKLTQIFSILHGLLSVGMSERDALETAAEASGNPAIQKHLRDHIAFLEQGTKEFADIADGFYIPLQAGFLLRNGFNSGREEQTLQNLATAYKRNAVKRADNLTNLLEPVANGVVGVIFAAVLIAVYLPVYDLFLSMTQVG